MIVCKRCRESKPETAFYLHRTGAKSRRTSCIACYAEECRLQRERNKARIAAGLIAPPEKKRCYSCKVTKPISEFHKCSSRADGYEYQCKACKHIASTSERTKAYQKRFYEANKARRNSEAKGDTTRRNRLRNGFTRELYDLALELQAGACAVCGGDLSVLDPKDRHADHCHATGTPRGILCRWCNQGLGFFQDSPELLKRAAEYVVDYTLKKD